jgi:hypothetical protein
MSATQEVDVGRSALSTALLSAVLCAAAPAAAQNAWDPPSYSGFRRLDQWPQPPRSGGSVEIGFWTASRAAGGGGATNATSVSGLLRAGVVISEVFEIGAVAGWGWSELLLDPFGSEREAASASNPLISGTFIAGEQRWRLRAGLGVTIPAAPNDNDARYPAFYASATRGLSELWLWAPARVSIVPMFSFEAIPFDFFYFDAAVRAGILIPIANDYPAVMGDPDSEVDFVIDTQVTLGFRHDAILIGARFRSVFLPTLRSDDDQAQLSLEPLVRITGMIDTSSGLLFGELRLMMNLDHELGFAFAELSCPNGSGDRCRGVWGVFLAIGGGA